MTDKKEKDVLTNVDAEEIITEEVITEDGVSEDVIDVVEIIEAEEPKKKGRVRGFLKKRGLAIGIIVLVVLLAANITVFGKHKIGGKGHHGYGGKTVEREYTEGSRVECGVKEGKEAKEVKEGRECKDGKKNKHGK